MSSSGSTRINWAGPEDIERLIPLMNALYHHEFPEKPLSPQHDVIAHITRLLHPTTPHRLAIAMDQKKQAIGLAAVAFYVSLTNPEPAMQTQAELKELFVLSDYRDRGVGTLLMNWVEEQARSLGACRIDWHVKKDNLRGIEFYQRFGAHMVEHRLNMRKEL